MTELSPARFKEQAAAALKDAPLQRALGNMRVGFIEKRRKAADALPEFEDLRDQGVAIKNHTLALASGPRAEPERRTSAGARLLSGACLPM
ncbi:MAG: hypothetical protein OXF57_08660 [Rhodospirillaceae bacterium]|nr:hypothetical protein [Rhodospirillaceae bacterium]